MSRRFGEGLLGVTFVAALLVMPPVISSWIFQVFVNGLHNWWNFIPFMTFGDAFTIMLPTAITSYAVLGIYVWVFK